MLLLSSWGISISLISQNIFNFDAISLQNSFATSVRLRSSRASLFMFRIIQWLGQFCFIMVRRYGLIFLRIEQECSLTSFEVGASNTNLVKTAMLENRTFCGYVNLRIHVMINGTSMLVLRSSKNIPSNDSCVSKLLISIKISDW